MKHLIIALGLLLGSATLSAKEFDSVFNTFKDTPNAEYVKVPRILISLGGGSFVPSEVDDMPMDMKITGVKVLEMESCGKAKKMAFEKAVNEAGKKCELMIEAVDGNDKATIWLEPKGKDSYSKMIIYSANDAALVELSGKFTPKK